MEGKGVLFKRFAGIDVFDLEVGSEDADDIIKFCQLLEPTVGGINLEDISAPECFVIEKTLRETMDIPVFHDDQHGTAIIAGAALINSLELVGKRITEVRVVFSGAGASALSSADHFVRLGVPRENITIVDSSGVIYAGRTEGMNEYKERYATETEARTLTDAMDGADVFVGLSVKGLVTPEMVASMARDPLIFALANPDPEILPEEVEAVRDDAIVATGRSDYSNQVNNVLGFPFIFRGALDVRAKGINDEMMMAATRALAELAREEVPDTVRGAYGGSQMSFGRDYVIPKPFDRRVLFYVAPAVAKAAMDTGLARVELDLEEYVDRLRASLGPGREVMRWMTLRARQRRARIVFPEGHNENILRAAVQMVEEGVAEPVLLGRPPRVHEKAESLGINLDGIELVYASAETPTRHRYADSLFEARARRGLTLAEAQWNLYKPIYYAAAMVNAGDADAMVAGIEANYGETLKPALQVVGRAEGSRHAFGLYMLAFPNRELLFLADTTVNIEPDARTLADIALQTAGFVQDLGIRPRIAMVSFSNFGSVEHPEARTVAEAARLVHQEAPELEVDGEMQADTAVDAGRLKAAYPFSHLKGAANVLIFSRLAAANAAYKLLHSLGGADAIGPVLLGMRKPVHILQRNCSVQDIMNLATIASVDWQARSGQI